MGRDKKDDTANAELDLFKLFILLRGTSRRVLTWSLVGFVVALALALSTKPIYTSTAVLLVPHGTPSATALALQLAGGLDLSGGGYEVYEDILRSRTVADRLIDKFQLKTVYGTKDQITTQKVLAKRTTIVTAKEGMVRILVEDTDTNRAAALANAYMAELDSMNQGLAITSAGQQRAYFEREMIKEKDALADAEVDLKRTQERTGVLVPQTQAIASLTAEESTRAQIRLRHVELGALLQGATEQNPEIVRLRAEINGLERQLGAMRTGGESDVTSLPTAKTPEVALENLRKAREVKFHEALFEMLARQYETAKQNEAKTISMIEVLDKAVPAEHKSWPPRTVFCLIGLLGGAFLSVFYTLGREFIRRAAQNSQNQKSYRDAVALK